MGAPEKHAGGEGHSYRSLIIFLNLVFSRIFGLIWSKFISSCMWWIVLCSISLKFSDVFVCSQSQFLYLVLGNQFYLLILIYMIYIYLSYVYECVYIYSVCILIYAIHILYVYTIPIQKCMLYPLFFIKILFKWKNIIESLQFEFFT